MANPLAGIGLVVYFTLLHVAQTTPPIAQLHFRQVGSVIGSLRYGHLQLDFDLQEISELIVDLCASVKELKNFNAHIHTGKDVRRRFQEMAFVIAKTTITDKLVQRCKNIRDDWDVAVAGYLDLNLLHKGEGDIEDGVQVSAGYSPDAPLHREERQVATAILSIAAIAGVIGSASGLFSIKKLLGLSDPNQAQILKALHLHETRFRVDELAIQELQNATVTLQARMTQEIWEMEYLEVAIASFVALERVSDEVQRLITGMRALHYHQLAPELIEPSAYLYQLKGLKQQLNSHGLDMLLLEHSQAYTYQTSHLMFENNTLRVFVHVPAFPEDGILDLYQFVPAPVDFSPNPEHPFYVTPDTETTLFATNAKNTIFRTITDSELLRCRNKEGVYYCKTSSLFDKRMESSCMGALFLNRYELIKKYCHFKFAAKRDELIQTSQNSFVLYQHEPAKVTVTCPLSTDSEEVVFSGNRMFELKEDCAVNSRSYAFYATGNYYTEPMSIQSHFMNFSFLAGRGGEEIGQLVSDLGLHEKQEGMTIAQLDREFENIEWDDYVDYGLYGLGVLLFAFFSGLCYCCCRKSGPGGKWANFQKGVREGLKIGKKTQPNRDVRDARELLLQSTAGTSLCSGRHLRESTQESDLEMRTLGTDT